MVLNIDVVTTYTACLIAAIVMILSVIEGHSPIVSLFEYI